MSARTAAKNSRKPHVDVGVVDQIVGRKARATAHATRWGKTKDDFDYREVDLEVEIARGEGEIDRFGPLGDPDCEVYINCTAHSGQLRSQESKRNIQIRNATLSDLPLLAMALQEAIRVGIKRGSFPPILGAES